MSLNWSPVYWHPFLYRWYIRWAYGGNVAGRYAQLAELVRDEDFVVEVCCGDARLYLEYLKPRGIEYLGLDLNPVFVRAARRRKVPVRHFDVLTGQVPCADVVIMQASLYQFLPDRVWEVCHKLLRAARRMVLLSEPVYHLGSPAGLAWIQWLAAWMVLARRGPNRYRFHRESFLELVRHMPGLAEVTTVGGGRELLAVFDMGPDRV